MEICREREISVPPAQKSWIEIGLGIFSSLAGAVEGYAENAFEKQKDKILRFLLSWSLMFLSAIFLLIALALIISEYFHLTAWAGYAFVGLGLFLMRMLIRNRPSQ